MASIKIVLDKRRQKANGTFPLLIRLTHHSKSRSIPLEIALKEHQWNDLKQEVNKSHPNFKHLNHKIKRRYIDIEKSILALNNNPISVTAIHSKLSNTEKGKNFFRYAEGLITQMNQSGKVGNSVVYQGAINKLINFYKSDNLEFSDLTYDFIKKYESALESEELMGNTISLYLRTIRIIYNKAVKSGLVDRINNPFTEISIKHEKTKKRAISKEKIKLIEKIDLVEKSPVWNARNYFILSFNLIGISFVDLATLKNGDINEGRVNYTRKKTGKFYSIKLTPMAQKIINYYQNKSTSCEKNKFLLPLIPEKFNGNSIEEHRYCKMRLKLCNKYIKLVGKMCGIEDHLTTYVARHSWATIAKKLGFSFEMISEAMGHEFGNKMTAIYMDNFEQEAIDNMNVIVTGDD